MGVAGKRPAPNLLFASESADQSAPFGPGSTSTGLQTGAANLETFVYNAFSRPQVCRSNFIFCGGRRWIAEKASIRRKNVPYIKEMDHVPGNLLPAFTPLAPIDRDRHRRHAVAERLRKVRSRPDFGPQQPIPSGRFAEGPARRARDGYARRSVRPA